MTTQSSRIPRFYRMSVQERVRAAHDQGLLSREDYSSLASGRHTLNIDRADKMIENVIGVMGLPVGLGLNFMINGDEYVVPLVVEEPSIVAALSSAAKTVRLAGGFTSSSTQPILIGQVQVIGVRDLEQARQTLLERKQDILNQANSLHPNMVARGGGATDVEVHIHDSEHGGMLILHLLVDTCDAMGANLVNTMCEGVASLVESITEGKVFLRILSNLSDRALVFAQMRVPTELLAVNDYSGEEVRDGIILAGEFAAIDPYRAATHNKGVMNGVDAVAIATGNDWRAIEAAAHAYASRDGVYTSLTRWSKGDNGELVGEIEIPMKVGTVGGPLQSNPTVALNHRILGAKSARNLAEIMGVVGLAQNFAALRALVTEGIQKGHMTLHARSVATAAGAPIEFFDIVVERLIKSGDIKIWKAKEIVNELTSSDKNTKRNKKTSALVAGHGKVIVLGEHAAVYGRHALAAPIPLAVQAQVEDSEHGIELIIPRWQVEQTVLADSEHPLSFEQPLADLLNKYQLSDRSFRIMVFPGVPRAMGLGGSAAVAVAIIRAIDEHFKLDLSDEEVNTLAFECEKVAHGTPSGVDNTLATYGKLLLYRAGAPPLMQTLKAKQPAHMVVGITGVESLTAKTVADVRTMWTRNKPLYESIFDQIDSLAQQGVDALKTHDLALLGDLMNVNQGLLNSLQVSSPELEDLIQLTRRHGALGAKLTGGGGGGSMIALCEDAQHANRIGEAIRDSGLQAKEIQIG
ncbi:MAG: hydroxymethylglutaryl-CoA reductase, degradative [Gammaproteobacteria bacterium]|nr:hydroxymethylglutaryl-CoA reductase, degradative [Gammaproteobacteria bacterium]